MDAEARSSFERFTDALDYPMFVVTCGYGPERSGCLVGFTTQTSIDPPQYLVCLSKQNHTYRVAQRTEALAVHALTADQRPVAALFGTRTGDEVDKFAGCAWTAGPYGVPLLDECPHRLVGTIQARTDWGGDHVGFLLSPVSTPVPLGAGSRDRELLSVRTVLDFDPGHSA